MKRPLVFALALTLSATGAWADRYSDCDQTKDLDRSIRGCTQVIERGEQESRKNRAVAYNNRGLAYYKKGEHDRAIADFTESIALDPNDAEAYYNRGVVYGAKGEFDRAIADYDEVIALNPKNASAYSPRWLPS
jgi:tetratricopeptide (TPR) repeat protein